MKLYLQKCPVCGHVSTPDCENHTCHKCRKAKYENYTEYNEIRRYQIDKVLCEDKYSVYDSQEERYIAENLIIDDAKLIMSSLNGLKC